MRRIFLGVQYRDIFFAVINGLIFAIFLPLIIESFGATIPEGWRVASFVALPIITALGVIVGKLLSRFIGFMFQLAKFGIVGASNTAVDLGVLQILIIASGVHVGYTVAGFKVISFTAAVINSYLWNKYWSFEKKETANERKEFVQFVLVSIVGLIVNAITFTLVFNIIGPAMGIQFAGLETIAAVVGTFTVLAWNFVGYKFIVFKK